MAILIEGGADVNAATSKTTDHGPRNVTPLSAAAGLGNVEAVRLLLAHNAEVDPRDKTFVSPLYKACRANNLEIVSMLLDAGAAANPEQVPEMSSPLAQAVDHHNEQLVALLLQAGAQANGRLRSTVSTFWLCRWFDSACRHAVAKIRLAAGSLTGHAWSTGHCNALSSQVK
eukprot:TRINITY_DN10815_c0_g1_i15.p1 TRINITY_DN10815_c0_g1~~TRINITY_DN10815_c0_g1_i15.p1  ORF type:complete len:188 (+),score=21.89 TRINITY_DN10815_c0_g1_i15:49-564(+)